MHKLLPIALIVLVGLGAMLVVPSLGEKYTVTQLDASKLAPFVLQLDKTSTCADITSSTDINYILAGRVPPGGCCKKNSDCALTGATCSCHRGSDPANRCCALDSGHYCRGNDECSSRVCTNGVCVGTGGLANGTTCTNNEECTSGHCLRFPTQGWVCG